VHTPSFSYVAVLLTYFKVMLVTPVRSIHCFLHTSWQAVRKTTLLFARLHCCPQDYIAVRKSHSFSYEWSPYLCTFLCCISSCTEISNEYTKVCRNMFNFSPSPPFTRRHEHNSIHILDLCKEYYWCTYRSRWCRVMDRLVCREDEYKAWFKGV
jgi:hypothetical protein